MSKITTAMVAGAGMAIAMLANGLASAATYTFTTTASSDSLLATGTAKTYASDTVAGTSLNARVTAWHWNNNSDGKIVAAQLGLWTPGIGVVATDSGETVSGNQHQIDNVSGVDFVMVQFNQAVSLTGISRAVYAITGVSSTDSDAGYWADSTQFVGNPSNWNSAINLANFSFAPSLWTGIPGTASSGSTTISGAPTAALWLIGADPNDNNDGFKLSQIKVNYNAPTAAVPEPATWAMFIGGFGLIGGTMRRRRTADHTAVSFA